MTNTSILKMPDGFLWGAATAAHQNEGGNRNNQWSAWEAQPGRIYAGQKSGAATGWWNLETAADDFDRAAEIGLNSLRISVEWSRIEPAPGVFDQTALRKYAEMIGLLRARGLEPLVTLHHFTDPLWLTEMGAWENPAVEEFFNRFVARVVEALGDQVTLWCTINEPLVYAYLGYLGGPFPPGVNSMRRAFNVLRRMLLAHGRAYRTIHRMQNNARVGLTHNHRVFLPAHPASAADRRAAALLDRIANRNVYEAITAGRLLPPLGVGQRVTPLIDACDYIGVNYYTPVRVAFDLSQPGELFARQFFAADAELSDTTFTGEAYGEINPGGLYLALQHAAAYGKPLYITENGLPDHDDDVRPRFIATHLAETWRAIRDGADVRGYYHWTLVDNFEWADAWGLRFGLFEHDPETGVRTPRTSAAVYSRIAQANGVPLSLLAKVAPEYRWKLEASCWKLVAGSYRCSDNLPESRL
jgi:beta-glucosidase